MDRLNNNMHCLKAEIISVCVNISCAPRYLCLRDYIGIGIHSMMQSFAGLALAHNAQALMGACVYLVLLVYMHIQLVLL